MIVRIPSVGADGPVRPRPLTGRYVYGIVDHEGQFVTEQRGFDGSPVCNLSFRGIGAAVSDISMTKVQVTELNVALHERIVEALMEDFSVLPARFGTILAGDERVVEMLNEGHASFVERLHLVRGRVELGLRVLWHAEVVRKAITASDGRVKEARAEATSAGRRYLMAKLEEELVNQGMKRRAELLAAKINGPLLKCAAEVRLKTLVTPRMVIAASYLAEKDKVETFRGEVERLRATHPDLSFLLTGPWPAYSFCGGEIVNGR